MTIADPLASATPNEGCALVIRMRTLAAELELKVQQLVWYCTHGGMALFNGGDDGCSSAATIRGVVDGFSKGVSKVSHCNTDAGSVTNY